jgi:peroxiredoxin
MTSGVHHSGMNYVTLEPGDPAPHFSQRCPGGEFNLSNLGGSLTALAFFPSSLVGVGKAILDIISAHAGIFGEGKARLLVVTVDREDEERLKDTKGFQAILDFDGKVARRYGALPMKVPPGATQIQYRPRFVVLDNRLRVARNIELRPDGGDAGRIILEIENLPALAAAEPELTPPVLIVPQIFPPEFCRQLIGLFESSAHRETGIVSQTGDRSTIVLNRDFKRRRDYYIEDPHLIVTLKEILRRRLAPEIAKAFQFQASHVERHIIGRYSAGERGMFRAHRDNYSLGTTYRRFAATINLNQEFEGGSLSFPEFGSRSFKAPTGGAIVFSCSLLHAVSEVTEGLRYAYLPFFFDEAAAKILEENRSSWTHSEFGPDAPALLRF